MKLTSNECLYGWAGAGIFKGYRNLMVGVLTTMIKDYIVGIKKKGRLTPALMAHAKNAEDYIFIDSKESDNYVFGFNFICRFIELDPERLRKQLANIKTTEDIEALEERIREL